MFRSAALVAGVCLSLSIPAAAAAQDPPPRPPLRAITITGAREISPRTIEESLLARVGEPLTDTPERLGESVNRHYRDEGYAFARVRASFDAASGTLSLDIDEGTIDAVVFQGIDEKLARTFADEFALRAGDVFNRRRARQALDVLLRPTRGSIRPGRTYPQTFTDSDELSHRRGTFDLVDLDGVRTLMVGLREPPGRVKIVPDLGEREDWFSSVDGFVPSLGMGIAVFDHDRFNHTFVAGHLSYKAASSRAGYSLGFERPLFGRTKLFVGGELHDLTASDDRWQLSSLEASLAAVGPRRSYRDYYNRRGVQITGALRLHRQVEALFAWRGERQEPLRVASDFSFWNSDEAFRPNTGAVDGRLNAVLLGASIDGRGFDRESLEATYRRHQFDTLFGERLDGPDGKHDLAPIWRVDWTSELSEAGAFGSDFDFRRHIVTGRARLAISERQTFGVRAIGGWSDGVLPP
ncbi:MAG TPA: POTRA domain-containing protein, partial [Vicinamibacterales bacterium]|nr:POTRA domain-containing protein [Vicinamibacterales bacterium]